MLAVRKMSLIAAAAHIVSWCCSVRLGLQTDMGGGGKVLLRVKLPVFERRVMLQRAFEGIGLSLALRSIYFGLLSLL